MNLRKLASETDLFGRLSKVYYDSFFSGDELTGPQAAVLQFVLEKGEHQAVFPKDVEAYLHVRPSSVTSLVNSLERGGYIRREKSSEDGRYRRLVATQKALDVRGKITDQIGRYVDGMFHGISDVDLEVYQRVLKQMLNNLQST